jgi:hypothetical protein
MSNSFKIKNIKLLLINKKRVVHPYVLQKKLDQAFLLLDSAPCHKTQEVRDAARLAKVKLIFVPPRLTNLLSPPDVTWFAPIKRLINKKLMHLKFIFTQLGYIL